MVILKFKKKRINNVSKCMNSCIDRLQVFDSCKVNWFVVPSCKQVAYNFIQLCLHESL